MPHLPLKRIACRSVADVAQNLYSLQHAEPCRFRFLEVSPLLDEDLICIVETPDLHDVPYAAASFVWQGLTSDVSDSLSFSVAGIEQEHAVSVEVLKVICHASRKEACSYLWLDKLSIRQDRGAHGNRDTVWQVRHMYRIYSGCKTCLVAAGGLQRLPALDEPTTWMERAWTLQEALAPPLVKCLFSWSLGEAILQHNAPIMVEVVVPGKVAMAELQSLLGGSLKGSVRLVKPGGGWDDYGALPSVDLGMLGSGTADIYSVQALLGAIDHRGGEAEEARVNAVWRCMLMRSAKLRQDLVFGAMGILGAAVEPMAGADPSKPYTDEQVGRLLVSLTQRLANKGLPAVWLGVIPQLGAAPGMSAMPILPSSDAIGSASIPTTNGQVQKVKNMLPADADMWWWLAEAPKARVLDSGDLVFRARAVPVTQEDSTWTGGFALQRDHPELLVQSDSKRQWTVRAGGRGAPYAIVVGRKQRYLSGYVGLLQELDTTLLMLAVPAEGGRLRNAGYAWADRDAGSGWEEHEFTVGG